MASNTIVTRVKDFLQAFPPFSYLPEEVLLEVAEQVHIIYFQENDYIFQEGGSNKDFGYVLKKGRIELIKSFEDNPRLIDVCDEGDVFGVRSLITNNAYLASARSTSDSIVYAIPKKKFKELFEAYPQLSLFFAAGFAAGHTVVHSDLENSKKARKDLLLFNQRDNVLNMSEEDILVLNPVEDIVSCSPESTVQEAAQKMKTRRVGSIIVLDEKRRPIGIVSDSDFTRKVIAGNVKATDSIKAIMSSPVTTLPPNTTIAQFTILSMKKGIRRIVITEDGTERSPVIGILSERDVLSMHGNNPAVLVKRMLKCRSVKKLGQLRDRADDIIKTYLHQEVSIPFIADVITEINDALIYKAIEFAKNRLEKEGVPNPKLRFSWLSLGSEGRGEQLLRTDQDNAIVYENPPEEKKETAKDYFLKLGTYAVETLIACGFAPCPGDIMASNPKWTQPLDGWKEHFRYWIEVPDPQAVMHGNIFFDFRSCYGDDSLASQLSDYIFERTEKTSGSFARFFVLDAIEAPPPLSFFKNFIVESSGKHKDLFDIKKRAMMPLAGAARMLMIADKVKGVNNTFKRYEKLAELHPKEKEIFDEAAMAYEIFMRYRAINGFKKGDSGRYIQPKDLNKIERQTLRTAFQSIDAVQRHLKFRFNLLFA